MTIAFGWPQTNPTQPSPTNPTQPNPTQPLQCATGTIHLLPGSLVHSTPAAATVRALPHDFPSEDNFVMGDMKKIPRSQALPLQCWLCSWWKPEQNSSVPGPLLLTAAVVGQWERGEQRVGWDGAVHPLSCSHWTLAPGATSCWKGRTPYIKTGET